MKNYLQDGIALDLAVPYDVASGDTFKVGGIIAIASTAGLLASAAVVAGYVNGCYTVKKATGAAWSVGDTLYWDDAAKNWTKTSTSNTKGAVAIAAAASGDTTGNIRLQPTI